MGVYVVFTKSHRPIKTTENLSCPDNKDGSESLHARYRSWLFSYYVGLESRGTGEPNASVDMVECGLTLRACMHVAEHGNVRSLHAQGHGVSAGASIVNPQHSGLVRAIQIEHSCSAESTPAARAAVARFRARRASTCCISATTVRRDVEFGGSGCGSFQIPHGDGDPRSPEATIREAKREGTDRRWCSPHSLLGGFP